ncbi:MAG: endonuclease V [Desulfobacterales bacterium]|nr:endonuclease V [Desulfobacterales bacterium]
MTIAAFDVHYLEDGRASAAAVLFSGFSVSAPAATYQRMVARSKAYRPGAFYRRELPAILFLLEQITAPLDILIVDGYVMLGSRPGMGRHLYETLGSRNPVIGVAKSRFKGVPAHEIIRGASQRPLYVTAAGMDTAAAAENIRKMHGPHRIPTLLRHVDRLAREGADDG